MRVRNADGPRKGGGEGLEGCEDLCKGEQVSDQRGGETRDGGKRGRGRRRGPTEGGVELNIIH